MNIELLLSDFEKRGRNGDNAFIGITSRHQIRIDINKRVKYPATINQGYSSLCGPTVFLQCIAKTHPEIYVRYIIDLFEKGEASIGKLKVKPGSDCKSLFKKNITRQVMTKIDWIGLASLRDSSNIFFDYGKPSDEFAGITTPGCLAGWFKKTGLFNNVINNTNLIFDKSSENLLEANKYRKEGYQVCLFLGSKILYTSNAFKLKKGTVPADHWAILNSQILLNRMPTPICTEKLGIEDKKISFNLQTWGEAEYPVTKINPQLKVSEFLDYYYGYVCVK